MVCPAAAELMVHLPTATGAGAVPPLRHCLQLGADAGLAPGTGHRQAGVRPPHEPCPHRRLRGGCGDTEHRPGGVTHQRSAAAEEPALLLPAVPRHPLRHLGAIEEDEPGEDGHNLPGAAEGDGDIPPPADLHPDRGEDGILRRCLPERDREEQVPPAPKEPLSGPPATAPVPPVGHPQPNWASCTAAHSPARPWCFAG